MGLADKCNLHIPYKRWAYGQNPNPAQEENNWNTLERWADTLLKRCLPSGGACIYAGEEEVITSNHGEGTATIAFTSLGAWTLSATIAIVSTGASTGVVFSTVSSPSQIGPTVGWLVGAGESVGVAYIASNAEDEAGEVSVELTVVADSFVDSVDVYWTITTASCGEGTHYTAGA